jgi:hypothetical protein
MRSGAFSNAEDVILHALRSSKPNALTGATLIAAMRRLRIQTLKLSPHAAPRR